jgi:hypothetical protein
MKSPFKQQPELRTGGPFRRGAALLGVVALLLGLGSGFCGESNFTEYQVKALFLLNFVKYVDWPAETYAHADTPVVIGIVGENNFGDDLRKTVAGKKINGRGIEIRQFSKEDDLSQCQILFISGSEKKRAADIVDSLKTRPVLTVGEIEGFTLHGGMINFVMKEGKVRLQINLDAARVAKLQISSKLLSVADLVSGKQ